MFKFSVNVHAAYLECSMCLKVIIKILIRNRIPNFTLDNTKMVNMVPNGNQPKCARLWAEEEHFYLTFTVCKVS